MWTPLLLAALSAAVAKPLSWLQDGAKLVEFEAGPRADLVLYRGPTTRYLPAVAARVPVEGQEALRPVLAIVDVAGGWSRVSLESAASLGITWEWTKVDGVARRVAHLARVELEKGVVIEELRVEVVADAPGLVLGFTSLDEVAVALLPSLGVVRLVPADLGRLLVNGVSTPLEATPQKPGDGLTLRVPGAFRWGPAVVDGTFHVETDEPTSLIAPSDRLPEPILRADVPYHDIEARLGEVWLTETWVREDPGLSDPAPDFWAALGYDVLFGLDLAVWPAGGQISFRRAQETKHADATEIAVTFARERYAQEEERGAATGNATTSPQEERVLIGFDGPKQADLALGDPGNPVVRDRNLDLADTLWRAGELDAALPHFLAASQFAGDHCGAHLRLAEARLAWSGTRIGDSLVSKLVLDPLDRAAALWSAWLLVDAGQRAAIEAGQDLPEGTVQVYQPDRCERARGLQLAVHQLLGNDAWVDDLHARHAAVSSVAFVRGLGLLATDAARAGAELQNAAAGQGADLVDLKVALALLEAAEGDPDGVVAVAQDVVGIPTDHPLTAAFGLLEAAQTLGTTQLVTRKVLRADDRWIPGQLVHAMVSGEPPPDWAPATEHRLPGSPEVACQKAVHLALSGQLDAARELLAEARSPAVPDWWTASAVVAHLADDTGGREEALLNLRLRFPLIPAGRLGLR